MKTLPAQGVRPNKRRLGTANQTVIDDLQSQLEALLDQVWRCEAAWRREDRVDSAIRYVQWS
jgi:hypothetical protein